MCNNMKNISKESGNRIDIIRFWSLMSLISLKPSIAEEFFGSWWPTASWWYFGFLKLEWHFMTRNSYNFKRERNQLAPKLASKLSNQILHRNFVHKVKLKNNVLFLPNRKGNNKILTPKDENSVPRGEAARDRILLPAGWEFYCHPPDWVRLLFSWYY